MTELRRKKVNVAELLSRNDATRLGELRGSDFLVDLLERYNLKSYSKNDPLIIFSTPELLDFCAGKHGPIELLAKQNLISLIVIDEFDCIKDCNQQHRMAYTTIVPVLKDVLKPSCVPFLYLSATGSSVQISDILSSLQASALSPKPILFQSEQILPNNHIYKGTCSVLQYTLLLP
jgi:superfamily II DNA helicase RecQ